MQHVVVAFHPGWWTPGTDEQTEILARSRDGLLDKRNAIFAIMRNIKTTQLLVAILDIGVTLAGKIATVDVRSSERIANALLRIEIRL